MALAALSYKPVQSSSSRRDDNSIASGIDEKSEVTSEDCLSTQDAIIHLVKGNLGPGCLNLPHAFALTGWLLGSALFLAVALQGIYSMWLLVQCKRALQHTHTKPKTFMDVARAALGKPGGWVVEFLLFVLQSGVCCVFMSLISTNLQAVTNWGPTSSLAVVSLGMMLIVMLRSVKDLVLLSATANSFMLIAIVTATVSGILNFLDNEHIDNGNATATSYRFAVVSFTADLFFAFEGIGLVLPVENRYRSERIFESVLVTAMSIVATLFLAVGVAASLGYPDIHSGSVTAYLEHKHPEVLWFSIINFLVMIAVAFTFPLQLLPAVEVLDGWRNQRDMCCRTNSVVSESVSSTENNNERSNEIVHGAETGGKETGEGTVVNFPIAVELCPQSEGGESVISQGGTVIFSKMESEDDSPKIPIDGENYSASGNTGTSCEETGEGVLVAILTRWAMVLGFGLVVLLVNNLAILISLFGAVGQTGLAGMPCAIHLALQYQGIASWSVMRSFLDVFIILICIGIMVAGCITSVEQIFNEEP